MDELRVQFQRDGFLVLENFLSPHEIEQLRQEGEALTQNLPPEKERAVFSTTSAQQHKDSYFLESADRVSLFFEADALDSTGKLQVQATNALNKVGHALHKLNPTFQKATFSNKVKEVCRRLGMVKPVVVQSMYIYKNPGIGSEVVPHQDASFLHVDSSDSNALVGFWIALDDATQENGCLQFIPGSHRTGVHRRLIRATNDKENGELLKFSGPTSSYPTSAFRSNPVSKGTCVLIHGQVVHQSSTNRSSNPRHAYTFHVADLSKGSWSSENWLQLPEGTTFCDLYSN